MHWYQYLAYFFGGAFLANSLPHIGNGVSGRPFQTPFAKPPGKGLSSSTINVLWGFLNLAVAYCLIFRVGIFNPFEFAARRRHRRRNARHVRHVGPYFRTLPRGPMKLRIVRLSFQRFLCVTLALSLSPSPPRTFPPPTPITSSTPTRTIGRPSPQGLVFVDGHLYESTGLNGQSSLRVKTLKPAASSSSMTCPASTSPKASQTGATRSSSSPGRITSCSSTTARHFAFCTHSPIPATAGDSRRMART